MVSIFPASEKLDSDLELDAGMHKTEHATRDMMGNVGAPFNFHHKRILNLAVESRFIGNAELTAAMISFFSRSVTLYGSRKRHLLLIMCGGDALCCKYIHCSTLRSFSLKTLMITHGVGTRGFLEHVYFLAAEVHCVLAVLTMLLHNAELFLKSGVQTILVLAQQKYTIDVIRQCFL